MSQDIPPIASEAALRAIVPAPSPAVRAKKLARLEQHAERILALSPLVGFAAARPDGRMAAGTWSGAHLARAAGPTTILVADRPGQRLGSRLDELDGEFPAALLFLLPGVGETLRVSGRGLRVADPAELARTFGPHAPPAAMRVEIEEAFLHCAKAVLRARLWDDVPLEAADDALDLRLRSDALDAPFRAFLARAPFALLATCDDTGRADVSPRGDPPGFLRALDERTLLLPDRRGNRLLDSLGNVLARPAVALLALAPGESAALLVRGQGRLLADPALLAASAVDGKAPALGLAIDVREVMLERAPALAAARIWRPEARLARDALPSFGRMLVEQRGSRGLRAAVAGRVVNAALDLDARKLY